MMNMNAPQGTDTPRARPPLPRWLVVTTVVLGFIAPLIAFSSRTGSFPPLAYPIFERLFFFNDYWGAIAMQLALVLALAWGALQGGVARIAEWIGAHPRLTCAIAFVVLALASRFVYIAHPFAMDEYAPMLQAQAFAHGGLAAQYPPMLLDGMVPPGFQGMFILVNRATGEAMSAYWPGLALLMTPFAFLHLSWCLNPALSALALWLIGDLAVRAGNDPRCRGWAMLAALASPQFTVNAISFYAMPGLLALNLLFLWLLLRPGWRSALLAGLVGSVALVLHNPVPNALMAVPCVVWLMADRARWPRLAALVAGYLPLTLALAIGWPMLEASMGMVLRGAEGAQGGFVDQWVARLSNIFAVPTAELVRARWFATWKMWIWACPGLLLLPFALRRRDATVNLLIAAFLLTFVFYFFVPFDQGHGWGYRYIHSAWAVLPICAGIWIATSGEGARAFGAAALAAGAIATPVFLWQTHETIADALAQRFEAPAEGRWIVFIAPQRGRYSGDLVQNLPGNERVLTLSSQGEDTDRALMKDMVPQAVEAAHDVRGSLWQVPEAR